MVHVVIILVVIGLLLYLVTKYIPMNADIQRIVVGVVVIAVVLWLLQVFGIFDIGVGEHLHRY